MSAPPGAGAPSRPEVRPQPPTRDELHEDASHAPEVGRVGPAQPQDDLGGPARAQAGWGGGWRGG